MEKLFSRSIDSLAEIFVFTGEFFDGAKITGDDRFAVDFAIEEIFTNLVKYAPEGGDEIRIRLDRTDDTVYVTVIDYDVEPFDSTDTPYPRTDLPLELRKPGGLGLHLTRRLMDSMDWSYTDRCNTVTLTRRLRSSDA